MQLCQRSMCGRGDGLPHVPTDSVGRKKAVSSQTSELEALEARLKATEERLKKAGLTPSTPTTTSFGRTSPSPNGRSSPRPRPGLGDDTFSPTRADHGPKSPLSSEFNHVSRPQTKDGKVTEGFGRQNMPGALPPTPGASEGESDPEPSTSDSEYVVVPVRRKRSTTNMGQDEDMSIQQHK
jgi:hypothetical protein